MAADEKPHSRSLVVRPAPQPFGSRKVPAIANGEGGLSPAQRLGLRETNRSRLSLTQRLHVTRSQRRRRALDSGSGLQGTRASHSTKGRSIETKLRTMPSTNANVSLQWYAN